MASRRSANSPPSGAMLALTMACHAAVLGGGALGSKSLTSKVARYLAACSRPPLSYQFQSSFQYCSRELLRPAVGPGDVIPSIFRRKVEAVGQMIRRHDRTYQIEHGMLFDPQIPDHQSLGRCREPILGSFIEIEALVAEVMRLVDPQVSRIRGTNFHWRISRMPESLRHRAKFHSPTARLAGAM